VGQRNYARWAVFGFVAVILGSLFYTLHATLESQKGNEVDRTSLEGMLPEAVQWIQNFHRIEIKEGQKAWELEAEEAQYLSESHQILVRKPHTTLYTKDGGKVTATGEQGKVQIVGKDLQSNVTSWNAGAERMFGFTAGEMVGQSITRLIPQDRLDEEEKVLAGRADANMPALLTRDVPGG